MYEWTRERGDRGQEIRRAQLALGITADGIFGPATEEAVLDYSGTKLLTQCTMQSLGIPIDMGIDVSAYQVDTDWEEVVKAGVAYAWRKVTEGQTHVNREKSSEIGDSVAFLRDVVRAKEVGIHTGYYHFGRLDTGNRSDDAKKEAEHFLSYIIPELADLPHVLDVESGRKDDHNYNAAWVIEWCEHVESKTEHDTMIYCARWAYNSYLKNADSSLIEEIVSRPLWLADYDGKPDDEVAPWDEYAIHQFTGKGSIPGVKGNCDVNWSAGGAIEKLINRICL